MRTLKETIEQELNEEGLKFLEEAREVAAKELRLNNIMKEVNEEAKEVEENFRGQALGQAG